MVLQMEYNYQTHGVKMVLKIKYDYVKWCWNGVTNGLQLCKMVSTWC